jgi:hypothetical protein
MTVTVDTTSSNAMADTLNTEIGANHELRLYDGTDTLLAQMVFSGSATVSTVSGAEALTYSEASYTDDETPVAAGTCTYATIRRMAATAREVVRFSDPTTELSLSSTSILTTEPVRVTADVVVKLPASTV